MCQGEVVVDGTGDRWCVRTIQSDGGSFQFFRERATALRVARRWVADHRPEEATVFERDGSRWSLVR